MPNSRHVALGTISFTVCFAAWGLISAFAPRFREVFHLSPSETAFLVAVPVILGALARIPMGMLTDRFGGRIVFTLLMAAVAVPVWLVPRQSTYSGLLAIAFLVGLAGSSFAIGVGYVSRWTPPERQGSALGVYGLGNIGQSAAVFLGPVLAARLGMPAVYRTVAVLLVLWAVVFALLARDAPAVAGAPRKGARDMIEVLTREKLSWLLAAFYFLTFGGFVAFSIYLPTLLKDEFGLGPADAGFRTAGFVVLATLTRPLGGWLSDRIGGARVLSAVFAALAPFAMLLAWPSVVPFTVGALGCAVLLGLGNGAVFKLVPQYFPGQTGTVTGLVGAMGGLGGFFPPILLAFFRQRAGAIWPGFLLLAMTALLLWWANHRVFVPRQRDLDIALPARPAPHCRPFARRRLGHPLDGRPGGRHRSRLAQSPELRPGPRHLHLRRDLRHLGRRLPLQRLARKAAHPRLLGSRLGARPAAAEPFAASSVSCRWPSRTWPRSASSRTGRACAGGCINSFSGAASWPLPSPSPWSSGGSTFSPCPATS